MKIKHAMILAAGLGKRMQPITSKLPKPLLQIGGKTLIDRTIDLMTDFGVEELTVNVHHLADKVIEFIKKKKIHIKINISDLIPLYPATEGVKGNRAFVLSGGGCDEKMQLFKIEIEMSKEEIVALDGKLTGLADSSEHIIMRLIPTDKFTTIIDDMKSVLAHHLSMTI